MINLRALFGAALLAAVAGSAVADEAKSDVEPVVEPSGDQRNQPNAPGEAVPGTSVRPEGMDQSNVPQTPLDRQKANAEDVGARNTNANLPPLKESDRNFLMASHQMAMAENAAAELAIQRATKASVKQYANQLLDAHQDGRNQISKLAKKNGVQLESELAAHHAATIVTLSSTESSAFDAQYLSEMIASHRAAVALHESTSQNSDDSEIKAAADRTLPVLRKHLAEAQRLQQSTETSAK